MRTIPKFMVWIAILSTILLGVCEVGVAQSDSYVEVFDAESIHADLVVVTSINRETHEVFAVNCNGITISFEEDDEWWVGDYAIVVFKYDPNSSPYDGEIIRVLYERPDLVAYWGSEFGIYSET